jgi:hypothetical protein
MVDLSNSAVWISSIQKRLTERWGLMVDLMISCLCFDKYHYHKHKGIIKMTIKSCAIQSGRHPRMPGRIALPSAYTARVINAEFLQGPARTPQPIEYPRNFLKMPSSGFAQALKETAWQPRLSLPLPPLSATWNFWLQERSPIQIHSHSTAHPPTSKLWPGQRCCSFRNH